MNGHQIIVNRVIDCIETELKWNMENNPDYDVAIAASKYPILAKSILVSPKDPARLTSDEMPSISYEYAAGTNNPTTAAGVQFEGESLVFQLNLIFEKYEADRYLINTSARWHDAFTRLVGQLRVSPEGNEVDIQDVILTSVSPSQVALSDRKHLILAIEIQWTYPSLNLQHDAKGRLM